MFKSLILGLALGIFSTAAGAAELVDLNIIRAIESSGNAKAVSFLGAKYGRGAYQVSEICLQDYNECTNSSVKPDELFDEKICYTISRWYLTERIPKLLRHYKITTANTSTKELEKLILLCYNWGIGNVVAWHSAGQKESDIPKETQEYYARYTRMRGLR